MCAQPNVGKSSLFNLLSGLAVPAMNFPFCTIDPNQAVVEVADARLAKLASLTQVAYSVPPSVTLIDIAGLVRGASEGLSCEWQWHILMLCCHAAPSASGGGLT